MLTHNKTTVSLLLFVPNNLKNPSSNSVHHGEFRGTDCLDLVETFFGGGVSCRSQSNAAIEMDRKKLRRV